MSKNLSAKYYQENEEILQRKACERYKNLCKEEKKKNDNIVINITNISQSIKDNIFASIEKKKN